MMGTEGTSHVVEDEVATGNPTIVFFCCSSFFKVDNWSPPEPVSWPSHPSPCSSQHVRCSGSTQEVPGSWPKVLISQPLLTFLSPPLSAAHRVTFLKNRLFCLATASPPTQQAYAPLFHPSWGPQIQGTCGVQRPSAVSGQLCLIQIALPRKAGQTLCHSCFLQGIKRGRLTHDHQPPLWRYQKENKHTFPTCLTSLFVLWFSRYPEL